MDNGPGQHNEVAQPQCIGSGNDLSTPWNESLSAKKGTHVQTSILPLFTASLSSPSHHRVGISLLEDPLLLHISRHCASRNEGNTSTNKRSFQSGSSVYAHNRRMEEKCLRSKPTRLRMMHNHVTCSESVVKISAQIPPVYGRRNHLVCHRQIVSCGPHGMSGGGEIP